MGSLYIFFRPVLRISRRGFHGYPTPLFFAGILRNYGQKVAFRATSEFGFTGTFAPIDFEKLNGFGRIGPAPRTVSVFLKNMFGARYGLSKFGVLTPHTRPHNTPYHTTYSSTIHPHKAPQGPHRSPHMAGRPLGKKRKHGGFQTTAAGRFGGKPAPPPEPLAADTRPQHDNDTCYEGDEENHSSSVSSQHSSDSDLSSCGSCSSGG